MRLLGCYFLQVILFPFVLLGLLISNITAAEISLKSWPPEAAAKLTGLIEKNAHQGQFAVFDLDNTTIQYNVVEALISFMENQGVLTREKLVPSLKPMPFKDEEEQEESLYSYFNRLCTEIDDRACYPWLIQVFSGLTLRELKTHLDAMMSSGEDIPVRYWERDKWVSDKVRIPRLFAGQQELFKALMDHGIEVYIISAGNEEMVRMLAADPKYGYHVKPENVIGTSTLLKDRKTGRLTTSDLMITQGSYSEQANLDLEITPYLWSPHPWVEGKAAVILSRIDRWQRPILAAGDSSINDSYMLLNALADDGIKLWINRSERHMTRIRALMETGARRQKELGLPVTADKNWVIVTPDEIH